MKQGVRIASLALALVVATLTLVLALWSAAAPIDMLQRTVPPAAIPLAVLGDSNSHSYQDRISFKPGSAERGGALRSGSLQWTEVLARLREQELDLGPWVRWGLPGVVAWGRELLGLQAGRAPRKEDYLYNFANSGAACRNLMHGRFRQAPRLVELMKKEPERWKRGVVVIRIGLNDWAGLLDLQSREPTASELRAVSAYCARAIGDAVDLIHASNPSTRILLVGIGNEADDPDQFERWKSASATANIRIALDGFNGAIRQLAATNPRVAFFDDLAWFEGLWGARNADGKPDVYKTVAIGSALQVTNTAGDDPRNALLQDHHAGLAWNALWARALVGRLKEAFDLPLTPISDEELARFVLPLVKQTKAPGS